MEGIKLEDLKNIVIGKNVTEIREDALMTEELRVRAK